MTPSTILARAQLLGLTLVPDGEHIRVRGPREAIEEIAPLVKQHKAVILATLATNDPGIADDLEKMIQDAAAHYQATQEDMEIMARLAKENPHGLRMALEADLLRPFYRRTKA